MSKKNILDAINYLTALIINYPEIMRIKNVGIPKYIIIIYKLYLYNYIKTSVLENTFVHF